MLPSERPLALGYVPAPKTTAPPERFGVTALLVTAAASIGAAEHIKKRKRRSPRNNVGERYINLTLKYSSKKECGLERYLGRKSVRLQKERGREVMNVVKERDVRG